MRRTIPGNLVGWVEAFHCAFDDVTLAYRIGRLVERTNFKRCVAATLVELGFPFLDVGGQAVSLFSPHGLLAPEFRGGIVALRESCVSGRVPSYITHTGYK